MPRPPRRIHHRLFIAKPRPIHLQGSHALDIPPHAQVRLLHLPILQKHRATQQRQYGIGQAILGKENPRQETRDGREEQKKEISLHKSKVKSDFGPKQVADLIEVVFAQQQALAEMYQQSAVGGLVVDGENGLDARPFAVAGRDACAAEVLLGPVDEVVDGENVLGFKGVGELMATAVACAGLCRGDGPEPVFYSFFFWKKFVRKNSGVF